MPEAARIQAIYRYPVKGLSPQPLERVLLRQGQTLPADRLYAIENGPTGFDPAHPAYFPKQRFLMLMRNERLAALRTDYDEASHTLTIERDGHVAARGELRGPPKVLFGDRHSFSDVAKKVVSIINLVSVAEIENALGQAVDPVRLRANVYVTGWPAWHEFELLGREIAMGGARLRVVKRIVRCAATEVDPQLGIRDLPIPATLQRVFKHGDCGMYAEVIADGEIGLGDAVHAGDLLG